jgi:CHASE2 domain-containing sensor protein
MEKDQSVLERTLLTVLLWAGLWGLIDIGIHRFQTPTRVAILAIIVITSFSMLKMRGHIHNL